MWCVHSILLQGSGDLDSVGYIGDNGVKLLYDRDQLGGVVGAVRRWEWRSRGCCFIWRICGYLVVKGRFLYGGQW